MTQVAHIVRVLVALLRRPDLWWPAITLAGRLIPNQWLSRGPFPDRIYLDYRGQAVYGMPLSRIPAVDFIRYLEWCRDFPGPIE